MIILFVVFVVLIILVPIIIIVIINDGAPPAHTHLRAALRSSGKTPSACPCPCTCTAACACLRLPPLRPLLCLPLHCPWVLVVRSRPPFPHTRVAVPVAIGQGRQTQALHVAGGGALPVAQHQLVLVIPAAAPTAHCTQLVPSVAQCCQLGFTGDVRLLLGSDGNLGGNSHAAMATR